MRSKLVLLENRYIVINIIKLEIEARNSYRKKGLHFPSVQIVTRALVTNLIPHHKLGSLLTTMPASSINLYMQDAKIKFEAMRPVPVCTDTSMLIGHCQKIHISTNCYYGYHDTKSLKNVHEDADCEMVDLSREGREADTKAISLPLSNTRKRSANHDTYYSQTKRIREERMVPTPQNYNPCLLRPTHNNPDISRCLMVHMI